jgi:hypothetical protein
MKTLGRYVLRRHLKLGRLYTKPLIKILGNNDNLIHFLVYLLLNSTAMGRLYSQHEYKTTATKKRKDRTD